MSTSSTIQPKNTWYCSVCDFYVFDLKLECNKCSSKRPKSRRVVSHDPLFDEIVCEFFKQEELEQKTNCGRCKTEGRIYNNEPLKSNHNCWKYS